jgi:hypothetical protein
MANSGNTELRTSSVSCEYNDVHSGEQILATMLLHTLLLLLHLSVASSASCNCSPVFVPVHVDVFVPKDPTDVFAGLKSNSSGLRRVDDDYNIYGVFCQPESIASRNAGPFNSRPQLIMNNFLLRPPLQTYCSSLCTESHIPTNTGLHQ